MSNQKFIIIYIPDIDYYDEKKYEIIRKRVYEATDFSPFILVPDSVRVEQ